MNNNAAYDPTRGNPILSKQGTTDAYKQYGFDPNGNNEIWGSLRRFFPTYFQGAASNAQFAQGLNGQRQSAISQLLNSLSPASQQAQLQGLQNHNTEQAAMQARQASLMNRANGMGDGFNAGTTNQMFGQAARQNNDLAREYASPQHQMAGLQAILQAIGYGQQNPELDELYRMGGVIEQRHQANQQEANSGGFLNSVLPMLGQAAGMGWNPFSHGGPVPAGNQNPRPYNPYDPFS